MYYGEGINICPNISLGDMEAVFDAENELEIERQDTIKGLDDSCTANKNSMDVAKIVQKFSLQQDTQKSSNLELNDESDLNDIDMDDALDNSDNEFGLNDIDMDDALDNYFGDSDETDDEYDSDETDDEYDSDETDDEYDSDENNMSFSLDDELDGLYGDEFDESDDTEEESNIQIEAKVTESNLNKEDVSNNAESKETEYSNTNINLELSKRIKELEEQALKAKQEAEISRRLLEEEKNKNKLKSNESQVDRQNNHKIEVERLRQEQIRQEKIKRILEEKQRRKLNSSILKANEKPDYSQLDVDALYAEVRKFLKQHNVERKIIALKILEDEFGKDNIRKLIIKSYLISIGKGVTVGK